MPPEARSVSAASPATSGDAKLAPAAPICRAPGSWRPAGSAGTGPSSLGELLEQCRLGEREAQRRLYHWFHESVYRVVVRIVGDQDAGDVTQQVFLQLFRYVHRYAGRSQFTTWLYRLATNEALQHLRRLRRCRHQSLTFDPLDRCSPRPDVECEELVEQALSGLTPQLRRILELRSVDGLSYRDIARAMQIPEGTVGSRLNRAKREARRQFSTLGVEALN